MIPAPPSNSKAVGAADAPDGFALSPIRAVFSDSIVRVVERAVKWWMIFTFVPQLVPQAEGRSQSDQGRIVPVRAHRCDLRATPQRIFTVTIDSIWLLGGR